MAQVTAAMVKELRERTQAGMADCKNALVEAECDMEKAIEVLKKKALIKQEKMAGRTAAQGAVKALVSPDARRGAIVELNCQTDFVARGEDFLKLLADATQAALDRKVGDLAALEATEVGGRTLKARADELSSSSGEKHVLRRVEYYEVQGSGSIETYVHFNNLIAVMVETASSAPDQPAVKGLAGDVALQVASMNPRYLKKAEVPAALVAKQREIFSAQMDKEDADALQAPAAFMQRVQALVLEVAQEEGRTLEGAALEEAIKAHMERSETDRGTLEGFRKAAEKAKARPAQAKDKILDGKVAKWLTDVVLLEQASVKESKKTIGMLVGEVAKTVPGTEVRRFVRYEVGEGIEKAAVKDFAQEVAEMAAKK